MQADLHLCYSHKQVFSRRGSNNYTLILPIDYFKLILITTGLMFSDRHIRSRSIDPDQTASEGVPVVRSGSTLFAIPSAFFIPPQNVVLVGYTVFSMSVIL